MDFDHPLLVQIEPLARSDQQFDARRLDQQFGQDFAAAQQLLQIIEHQQHAFVAQKIVHLFLWAGHAGQHKVERRSQCRKELVDLLRGG